MQHNGQLPNFARRFDQPSAVLSGRVSGISILKADDLHSSIDAHVLPCGEWEDSHARVRSSAIFGRGSSCLLRGAFLNGRNSSGVVEDVLRRGVEEVARVVSGDGIRGPRRAVLGTVGPKTVVKPRTLSKQPWCTCQARAPRPKQGMT